MAENYAVINQSFRRSTKFEDISSQISLINQIQKPLHVSFLAGSVNGTLEGQLKVVQAGLGSFLKAI